MTLKTYLFLAFSLVGIQLLGSIGFAITLGRLLPSHLERKYAFATRLRYKLLFVSDWRDTVEEGDTPAIGSYRRILLWFYVFSLMMICLQGVLWLVFEATR